MMLWLLHEHHILPGTWYRMPEGEKVLLRAFFERIMELREENR